MPTLTKAYRGATPIQKIYRGTTLLFDLTGSAPVATGVPIIYQAAETDDAATVLDLSTYFTGTDSLSSVEVSTASDFSTGLPTGVTVDAAAATATFDWSAMGETAETTFYVRATNVSGSATRSFLGRVIAALPADQTYLGVGTTHGFRFNLHGTDDPAQPVLINHHGSSGKDDGTSYNAGTFTSTYGLASYGPHFPDADYLPGWPTLFDNDAYQRGGAADLEQPLLDAVRRDLGQPDKPALIYGHSAGGQWVSRVAAYAPVSNVDRYVIANPSTWVFPVRTGADGGYPANVGAGYGFDAMGANDAERDAAIAAYLQLPITVYSGELDTQTSAEDPSLATGTEADEQGATRRERALNVFAAAEAAATRLGVTLAWRFVTATGVGHSGTSMLNAAEVGEAFFNIPTIEDQSFTVTVPAGTTDAIDPVTLFSGGELGWHFDLTDLSTMNTLSDQSGTVPAVGDPVGYVPDLSGNAVHATATGTQRPVAAAGGLTFDADARLTVNVAASLSGSLYYAGAQGKGAFGVDYPALPFNFGAADGGQWDDTVQGLTVVNRAFTQQEIDGLAAHYSAAGDFNTLVDGQFMFRAHDLKSLPADMTLAALQQGGDMFYNNHLTSLPAGMALPALINGNEMFRSNPLTDISSLTCDVLQNGDYMFRNTSITAIPAGMTLSALTSGYGMFYGTQLATLPDTLRLDALQQGTTIFRSTQIVSIPAGTMTLPAATNMEASFQDTPTLTTLPADFASATNCTKWTSAFTNTALTQQSIDTVLANLDARGTSNGGFTQSGGSAPSATGEAAITSMRSRGWTITVTGGF